MTEPELTTRTDLEGHPFAVLTDARDMVAFLEKTQDVPWECGTENFKDLARKIAQLGIRRMDVQALNAALQAGLEKGGRARFAEGVPAVDARNGYVQHHFDTETTERLWAADDSEKIDFRTRSEDTNVSEGQLLAELVAPTEPKTGETIRGEIVSAKSGRKARLRAGKNVTLNEAGDKAFAAVDGAVSKVGSKVVVQNVRRINGDVDFRSGNVDFNGDVIVSGDVKEGFYVKADGAVDVAGVVDRSSVEAGGALRILGGLYGKEDVVVRAEGDVFLGFAENAVVKAGGNLYVRTSMINCDAEAGGIVFLKATGKSLIGGRTKGALGVRAYTLGHPRMPAKTIVEFGEADPETAARARELRTELEALAAKGRDALTAEEMRRIAEIREEMDEIRERLEALRRACCRVRHVVHPGVVFVSGKAAFEVKHEISRMVFYRSPNRNEIVTHALSEKTEKFTD